MTSEWMTQEEVRQRSGMAFFEEGDRLERVRALVDRMRARTMRDEVWVSALDDGVEAVRAGRIFGMRVVVTSRLAPGEVRVWSYGEGEFHG